MKEASLLPSPCSHSLLPLPSSATSLCPTKVSGVSESSSTNPQRQVHKECGVFSSKSASFCYFIVLWVALGWILRAKQHPKAAEGALAAGQDSAQPPWVCFVLYSLVKLGPSNLPKKLHWSQSCVMSLLTKYISLKGELLCNRLNAVRSFFYLI